MSHSTLSKAQVEDKLETLKHFMEHDIDSAIIGKANYLAALGLVTYTEVMGGLLRGNLSKNNSGKNFDCFIEKCFRKPYSQLDARLKADGLDGLYHDVRCGLVHEYFIKRKSSIVMHRKRSLRCGIIYRAGRNPKLKFVVGQYFLDFKTAFSKYRNLLQSEPDLVTNFNDALNSVNSVLIEGH